jgi:hypothetical protein
MHSLIREAIASLRTQLVDNSRHSLVVMGHQYQKCHRISLTATPSLLQSTEFLDNLVRLPFIRKTRNAHRISLTAPPSLL